MLEALSAEVVEALKSGGVKAGAAYPKTPLDRSGGPFVQVGVRSAASSNAAFAGYLGSKIGEDGQSREIYGMKCAVSLALDIYASMASDNGHMACVECFDCCVQALAGLNTGLKIKEMVN